MCPLPYLTHPLATPFIITIEYTNYHPVDGSRLQEDMRLWVQMREPGKSAKAALQIGDRAKQTRYYQDALYYYKQALKVKSLSGSVRADALNAISLIYADLYLREIAERYFNRALDQRRHLL